METIFVCWLSLLTSAIHVYMRDVRHLVEVATTILFWMVPIFYDFRRFLAPSQFVQVEPVVRAHPGPTRHPAQSTTAAVEIARQADISVACNAHFWAAGAPQV